MIWEILVFQICPAPSPPLPLQDYADLHVLAVSLLALCLEEGGQMAALQASDTLQQLLGHISNGSGPEMKRNAVRVAPQQLQIISTLQSIIVIVQIM